MQMKDAARAIAKDWALSLEGSSTEAALLAALAARISVLLRGNSEDFFQLMYRLDIDEQKLVEALAQPDVPAALAVLIWHRQLKTMQSRASYPAQPPTENDLKW